MRCVRRASERWLVADRGTRLRRRRDPSGWGSGRENLKRRLCVRRGATENKSLRGRDQDLIHHVNTQHFVHTATSILHATKNMRSKQIHASPRPFHSIPHPYPGDRLHMIPFKSSDSTLAFKSGLYSQPEHESSTSRSTATPTFSTGPRQLLFPHFPPLLLPNPFR